MKALIVEDEQLAIDGLRKLLAAHADFIELKGIARNGGEAVSLIGELKPDLVFLDINIPVWNGLEVLSKISCQPRIVFTTAYDEYAIKAFEMNSVDYLLKPIEPGRFAITINRLKNLAPGSHSHEAPYFKLLENLISEKEFTSVSVKTGDRILFIPLEEITHFFAEEKYVLLNTLDSKKHITSFTIQQLEETLPRNFIRISRSVVVNRFQIAEALKLFGKRYQLVLKDAQFTKVDTGTKYVGNFLRIL